MLRIRGSVGVLLLAISFPLSIAAQGAAPEIVSKSQAEVSPARGAKPTQNTQPKIRPEDQQQALDLSEALWLVDDMSNVTTEIKDDRTRIQVQARLADALWEHNEARARRLFEIAFLGIDSIKFENKKGVSSILKELSEQSQLRNEVLKLVARHDLSLSAKLLKSVAEETSTADASSFTLGTKSALPSLYLQVAIGAATVDPKGAAQMIKASLDSGVDPQIAPALFAVRVKDPALADSLFSYALSIAQRDSAQAPLTMNYLAPYVFPNYGQGVNYFQLDPNSAAPQANAMIGEFLNFSYAVLTREIAAAKPGASATLAAIDYSTAKIMLPYFDQYMPNAGVVIRIGLTKLTSLLRGQEADMIDTFTGLSDIEEILQRAEKAQQEGIKDAIYSHAAILTARKGDTERALSIVEKIRNESLRSEFDSIIRYQAAMAAIGKGDAELALRYAKSVGNLQMYANAMSQLARLLQRKKETAGAGDVLTNAADTVAKADNGFEKVCAILIITNATAELDPVRGFEMMSGAVRIINQTDIHLNRSSVVTRSEAESSVLSVLNASSGLNSLKFDESFAWLARFDFQRALSLARSLDKKEAAVLAQLAVCNGLMAKLRETSKPVVATLDGDEPRTPPQPSRTDEQSIKGTNVRRPEEERLQKAP